MKNIILQSKDINDLNDQINSYINNEQLEISFRGDLINVLDIWYCQLTVKGI